MSLKKKLIYWMVGLVVAAILIVGSITSIWTRYLFDDYVDQHFQYRVVQLQELLISYYQYYDSWQGIENIFILSRPNMMGRGHMMRYAPRVHLINVLSPGERLRLVDASGRIILDSWDTPGDTNQVLETDRLLQASMPIQIDNAVVGYMLWETAQPTNVQTLERSFTNSMYKTTLIAVLLIGLGAGLVARQIAGKLAMPLESLTKVAQRFNKDKVLEPIQLPPANSQEAEQLALAFNQMVTQLNRHELLRRQLMADVAHELRTPLTILRCNLEALAQGALEPSTTNLGQLENEIDRLVDLVGELQELSLIEQHQ
ncbi:MAG: histidine kinase dimerization/phospho-acceptor domain-containing protein, partial [Bacillota bacterium]|nr:histidine kinase dimerization/phospho-acceptor domain-containing protein [Bacillota bacterium]